IAAQRVGSRLLFGTKVARVARRWRARRLARRHQEQAAAASPDGWRLRVLHTPSPQSMRRMGGACAFYTHPPPRARDGWVALARFYTHPPPTRASKREGHRFAAGAAREGGEDRGGRIGEEVDR